MGRLLIALLGTLAILQLFELMQSRTLAGEPSRPVSTEVVAFSRGELQAQREQICVVTLSNTTDELFGDYKENANHERLLLELLEVLPGASIKAIGFDQDLSQNGSSSRHAFLKTARGSDFPIVLTYIRKDGKLPKPLPHMGYGHPAFYGVPQAKVRRRPIDIANEWAHPTTRFNKIEIPHQSDGVKSFASEVLKLGMGEKMGANFYKLRLRHYSEEGFCKVPIEKVLSGEFPVTRLKGKFLLVGKDYEALDALTNNLGERVNGVFLHAEALSLLLAYTDLALEERQQVKVIELLSPESAPEAPSFIKDSTSQHKLLR